MKLHTALLLGVALYVAPVCANQGGDILKTPNAQDIGPKYINNFKMVFQGPAVDNALRSQKTKSSKEAVETGAAEPKLAQLDARAAGQMLSNSQNLNLMQN